MRKALLGMLDWYSEASPQDRLDDNGERALNLLLKLNEGDNDSDALTALLECVNDVLEKNRVETDATKALRATAMEWQD